MHSGVCLLVSRCRDSAVIQEQDEEEVKDSLLRGREGGEERSPEEEEDGEACPPLLPTPSIPQRLQSTLHNINLSIQQVSTNQSHLSPSGGVALVASEPEWGWDITHTCLSVCSGEAARRLWKCRQWKNLAGFSHLGTGDVSFPCCCHGDQCWLLAIIGPLLNIDVLADDGAGGQRGGQRKAGVRGPAGLDPERHAQRQHPFWAGVSGGQVRQRHLHITH